METQEPRDGWTEFAELLGLIRTLFGDALKASDTLVPKLARDASRWLRAAEAFARVLVLTLARTVVLTPAAPRGQRTRLTRARAGGGRSLFSFACASRAAPMVSIRVEMSEARRRDWFFFGGKERAAAERASRAHRPMHLAKPPVPAARAAGATFELRLPGRACLPSQANLVRRFNALVRVIEKPDAAATRLARRLAAAPELAQRILATAFPRERWRSGYDETIQGHAHTAAAGHDSS